MVTRAIHVQSSDDEDDVAAATSSIPSSSAGAGCATKSVTDDLVIFRIPHKHPHMLKRPLQHVDGLTFLDMAVRTYVVTAPADNGEVSNGANPVSWHVV